MEAIQVLQLQTDAKHRRITGQVKKSCRCFKVKFNMLKDCIFFQLAPKVV